MNYFRCPNCDKLILFKDEINEHCFNEHGHSADYLIGYRDAINNISKAVEIKNDGITLHK